MKTIETLVPDIQHLVTTRGWFNDELAEYFGRMVAQRVQDQYREETRAPTLRLSQMGPRCPKALWHSIHTPWEAEALPPWAEVKFTFGHIIEALAITLAKAAGHSVEGEQDEVRVDGIAGHRDCVIDGCIVDVKSSSSLGMDKYRKGTLHSDDPFGYLDQLDGYLLGSADDPLVKVKDKGYLLVIDKTLGHMVLYEHTRREQSIRKRIQDYKEFVARDQPPECTCGTRASGNSGNIELDLRASYSPFKHSCFPNLRTFIYANGPRYLTEVKRLPDVPEIHRSIHRQRGIHSAGRQPGGNQ